MGCSAHRAHRAHHCWILNPVPIDTSLWLVNESTDFPFQEDAMQVQLPPFPAQQGDTTRASFAEALDQLFLSGHSLQLHSLNAWHRTRRYPSSQWSSPGSRGRIRDRPWGAVLPIGWLVVGCIVGGLVPGPIRPCVGGDGGCSSLHAHCSFTAYNFGGAPMQVHSWIPASLSTYPLSSAALQFTRLARQAMDKLWGGGRVGRSRRLN